MLKVKIFQMTERGFSRAFRKLRHGANEGAQNQRMNEAVGLGAARWGKFNRTLSEGLDRIGL
jgi:hypothetical protein